MLTTPFELKKEFWETFDVSNVDLEFIYNFLLEIEIPQTSQEITIALVKERIEQEKKAVENLQKGEGSIYLPKEHYQVGQKIIFPAFKYRKAHVINVRKGNNKDLPPFEVIEVVFDNNEKGQFAAGYESHKLNDPITVDMDNSQFDVNHVIAEYGDILLERVSSILKSSQDLALIADRWFPKALLVDVNIGYLNLAEALLDMEKGGPLPIKAILEQIELPSDVNLKLTEFSLNYALQKDERFDEVGPSGEVLWFLRRYEPDSVKNTPDWLRYYPINYNSKSTSELLSMFGKQIADELEVGLHPTSEDEITISLIYPHWRAGTLPLSTNISQYFPTAYESQRVQFIFVDGNTGQKFPGWVVRPSYYVYGLLEWYRSNGLIPGGLVTIKHGEKAGEVLIYANKRRPTREWIRTVLVGSDGGIVFAMLKQLISVEYDERLAIFVPDTDSIDLIWKNPNRQKKSLEQIALSIMHELVKLNPQGNVHAQELYAAVNIIRRFPPGPILDLLANSTWATHLGDLHFRFNEHSSMEIVNE